MSARKSAASVAVGAAAAIALAVPSVQKWEGVQLVAERDSIGTGQPVTYCYGQTNEYGKVRIGTRFTIEQCEKMLLDSLPKYNEEISECIDVPISDMTRAALIQTAYNTGSYALCHSPIVEKLNKGDYRGACNALKGWYVRSRGVVRRGLVARRQDAAAMCLNGLKTELASSEPKKKWYLR